MPKLYHNNDITASVWRKIYYANVCEWGLVKMTTFGKLGLVKLTIFASRNGDFWY